MKRSATRAATIEKALSQPNRRSDGRSEKTVTTRPQASTTVVRISAGPTSTVARSTAMSEVITGLLSSRRRLREWVGADKPRPDDSQYLARIEVGHAAEHNHRILFGRDEAAHQMLGDHADILLERVDIRAAGLLGEPAAQRFQRPYVADACRGFHGGVHVGDH